MTPKLIDNIPIGYASDELRESGLLSETIKLEVTTAMFSPPVTTTGTPSGRSSTFSTSLSLNRSSPQFVHATESFLMDFEIAVSRVSTPVKYLSVVKFSCAQNGALNFYRVSQAHQKSTGIERSFSECSHRAISSRRTCKIRALFSAGWF